MKLNLEQLANTILTYLDKTELCISDLDDIIKHIKKTDISYMEIIFKSVKDFLNSHKRFPSHEYLSANFSEFFNYSKVKYNDDILKEFLFVIKRDHNLSLLNDAVNKKDLNNILNIINEIDLISTSDEPYNIDNIIKDSFERSKYIGEVNTGISELDDYIGGYQRKATHIIAAPPGGCKTTFALNIAYNAIKNDKNVLFISLEISSFNLYSAILSRHSKEINCLIKQKDIKRGNIKDKLDLVTNVKNDFKERGYGDRLLIRERQHIGDFSPINIRKYLNKLKNNGVIVDVLIVDYINLMKFENSNSKNKDPFEAINQFIDFFNKLAIEYNFVNILLMQVNRDAIEILSKGKNVDMNKLAEANQAERCANTIILLSTYADLISQSKIKIDLLKNRDNERPHEPIYTYTDLDYSHIGGIKDFNNTVYLLDNNKDILLDDFEGI